MALARYSVLTSQLLLDPSSSNKTAGAADLKAAAIAASKAVESYCNRNLEEATYTGQLYSGTGYQKRLWLRDYPAISTGLAVAIWDGDAYTTESSSYYELLEGRYLYYPKRGQEGNATYGAWPEGDDNIKVTYTAGYATTDWEDASYPDPGGSPAYVFDVPRDLELAVAKIAALIVLEGLGDNVGGMRLGVLNLSAGGDALSIQQFEKGIPPDCLETIRRYKRVDICL